MKRNLWIFGFLTAFCLSTVSLGAQALSAIAAPQSLNQAVSLLGVIYSFAHNGQWLLAGSALTELEILKKQIEALNELVRIKELE